MKRSRETKEKSGNVSHIKKLRYSNVDQNLIDKVYAIYTPFPHKKITKKDCKQALKDHFVQCIASGINSDLSGRKLVQMEKSMSFQQQSSDDNKVAVNKALIMEDYFALVMGVIRKHCNASNVQVSADNFTEIVRCAVEVIDKKAHGEELKVATLRMIGMDFQRGGTPSFEAKKRLIEYFLVSGTKMTFQIVQFRNEVEDKDPDFSFHLDLTYPDDTASAEEVAKEAATEEASTRNTTAGTVDGIVE